MAMDNACVEIVIVPEATQANTVKDAQFHRYATVMKINNNNIILFALNDKICPRLTCDDNRNCAMCEKMLSTENCDQCRTVLVNQITDPNNYQINSKHMWPCNKLWIYWIKD